MSEERKPSLFIVGQIDSPESIWVDTHKGDIEYIRADLVAKLTDAINEAVHSVQGQANA